MQTSKTKAHKGRKTALEIELDARGLNSNFEKKDPVVEAEKRNKKIDWDKFPF